MLDFGFLTGKASWIHRIFIIWCHDKKNKKIKFVYNLKVSNDSYKFCYKTFWKNSQKIQNLKKFECFNRFWPNSIPKFLDGCNIFVCSFRTIARKFTKVRATPSFFQKIQNSIKSQIGHQLSWKWSRLKCCDCITGAPNFISISQAVYELSGFQTLKIGHIHTHTHTHIHPDAS